MFHPHNYTPIQQMTNHRMIYRSNITTHNATMDDHIAFQRPNKEKKRYSMIYHSAIERSSLLLLYIFI